MGTFVRGGTFRDRARFLEALRSKLSDLLGRSGAGVDQTWETRGDADVATLSGLGARVEFVVGLSSWTCSAEIPVWLPISQKAIEDKFDREFKDLEGL